MGPPREKLLNVPVKPGLQRGEHALTAMSPQSYYFSKRCRMWAIMSNYVAACLILQKNVAPELFAQFLTPRVQGFNSVLLHKKPIILLMQMQYVCRADIIVHMEE